MDNLCVCYNYVYNIYQHILYREKVPKEKILYKGVLLDLRDVGGGGLFNLKI